MTRSLHLATAWVLVCPKVARDKPEAHGYSDMTLTRLYSNFLLSY